MRPLALVLALGLTAGCETTGYSRAVGNDIGRGMSGSAAAGAAVLELAIVGIYYAGKGIVRVVDRVNETGRWSHGGSGKRPKLNREELLRLHEKSRRAVEPDDSDIRRKWRRAKRRYR